MAIGDDKFLAACFRYMEKPKVDFAGLASSLGMSTGGASNKFRAIMKKFEQGDGSTWANGAGDEVSSAPATPKAKRKAPASSVSARKRVRAASVDTDVASDDGDDSGPAKKTKVKPRAKTNGGRKKAVSVTTSSEEDDGVDDLGLDSDLVDVDKTEDRKETSD